MTSDESNLLTASEASIPGNFKPADTPLLPNASEASANVGTKLQLRPPERPVRSEKPRLARHNYVGEKTYHLTLTTRQRAPLFGDLTIGRRFEQMLQETAVQSRFELLAYCFMPDHLHVLALGLESNSDLLAFVQRFKQRTGFWFKSISGDRPWQQSFNDRFLRAAESPAIVAKYILDNPAEEGLPKGSPAFLLRGGTELRSAPDGAKAASLHQDS